MALDKDRYEPDFQFFSCQSQLVGCLPAAWPGLQLVTLCHQQRETKQTQRKKTLRMGCGASTPVGGADSVGASEIATLRMKVAGLEKELKNAKENGTVATPGAPSTAGGLRTYDVPMCVMADSYKASHFLMYPECKSMTAYGEFREPMKGMLTNGQQDNRFVVIEPAPYVCACRVCSGVCVVLPMCESCVYLCLWTE